MTQKVWSILDAEKDISDPRTALSTVDIEGTVTWDELKAEVGL
jgi:hypothetical protein